MKYRTLSSDGDYTFGKQTFLFGTEAVAQAIKTRLKLLYGEWWENTSDGLPLYEKILGSFAGDANRQAIDLVISDRIKGTQGVLEISYFKSSLVNRHYSAQCIVKTVYGETTIVMRDSLNAIEVVF